MHSVKDDLDFRPEIDFDDGMPIPPNVQPLIILQGSDYQLGYQYATQLCHIFGSWILERMRLELSDAELGSLKKFLALVEQFTPEFVDYFKGYSDATAECGVPMDFWQAMATHFLDFDGRVPVFPREASPHISDMDLNCSGLAAWGKATKDGRLYCIGTGDGPTGSFQPVIMVYPGSGNSFVFSAQPCTKLGMPFSGTLWLGGHPGMNNKGLGYAHHGWGIDAEDEQDYGIPLLMQEMHTLRYADDADKALDIQLAYPKGCRAHGVWADTQGRNFVLECRYPQTIRRSGDFGEQDFLYASNTCLSPSLEKYMEADLHRMGWPMIYVEHGGWNNDDLNSVRRNLYMWNMLHNYNGEVDGEFLKMLLRLPNDPPAYDTLEEADRMLGETFGRGWDLHIGNLGNAVVCYTEPDDGNEGMYHACSTYLNRKAQAFNAGLKNFFYKQLSTFYDVKLAGNIDLTLKQLRERTSYDQYYANKALSNYSYMDACYAPLLEKYDESVLLSQKAEFQQFKAMGASPEKALFYKAKAARYYARSQCYAKYVTEALVKQPECPSDLGLREWKGDWGEWEAIEGCPLD